MCVRRIGVLKMTKSKFQKTIDDCVSGKKDISINIDKEKVCYYIHHDPEEHRFCRYLGGTIYRNGKDYYMCRKKK